MHERVPPIQAIQLAKDLEPFKLFFLEDVFAPEDVDYFRVLRQQSAGTPQPRPGRVGLKVEQKR